MEISIFGFDPPPLKEISISLFLFFFLSLSQLINLCGVSKATYHVQGSNVIELTKYWLQYAGFNLNQSVGQLNTSLFSSSLQDTYNSIISLLHASSKRIHSLFFSYHTIVLIRSARYMHLIHKIIDPPKMRRLKNTVTVMVNQASKSTYKRNKT